MTFYMNFLSKFLQAFLILHEFHVQDDDDQEAEFEMYRVQGTLREWVTRDEVQRFIAKKFKEGFFWHWICAPH